METTIMSKYCSKCGDEIHPKRVQILPGVTTCVSCSNTQPKRSITVQLGEGDHTYNELIIMDAEDYQKIEQYINPKAKSLPLTPETREVTSTNDDSLGDTEEEEINELEEIDINDAETETFD